MAAQRLACRAAAAAWRLGQGRCSRQQEHLVQGGGQVAAEAALPAPRLTPPPCALRPRSGRHAGHHLAGGGLHGQLRAHLAHQAGGPQVAGRLGVLVLLMCYAYAGQDFLGLGLRQRVHEAWRPSAAALGIAGTGCLAGGEPSLPRPAHAEPHQCARMLAPAPAGGGRRRRLPSGGALMRRLQPQGGARLWARLCCGHLAVRPGGLLLAKAAAACRQAGRALRCHGCWHPRQLAAGSAVHVGWWSWSLGNGRDQGRASAIGCASA